MVAVELFDLVDRFGVSRFVGLEDFADKLSFLFTVIILIVVSAVITVKSYVLKSIACYANNIPAGGDFEEYLENYCWVRGTIPFYPGQKFPSDAAAWKELEATQKINYYQWIPFILGLQCVMFYLPRLMWQIFCFSKGGTDLEMIIKQAISISEKPISERPAEYENLARVIENMLVLHRDFRVGRGANLRRKVFSKCSMFMSSKRLGTMLVFWYFMIKLLYLANAIIQLFMIQAILGFNNSLPSFGATLTSLIWSGKEWEVQNYFPRVVFCNAEGIQHVGTQNNYIAQCVLPVNMLNEKIYAFLWFWILMVAIITFISIPLWINRLFRGYMRDKYIRKFLRMVDSFEESKRPLIHRFVNDFMRHDGMFLLRMIANNAGDLLAAHLVLELWKIYLSEYQTKNLRKDILLQENMVINLEIGDNNTRVEPSSSSCKSSTPLHYL